MDTKYKKLSIDTNPIPEEHNYITINTSHMARDPNFRIISLFWNGQQIFYDKQRYKGYAYVGWFKI